MEDNKIIEDEVLDVSEEEVDSVNKGQMVIGAAITGLAITGLVVAIKKIATVAKAKFTKKHPKNEETELENGDYEEVTED